MAVAQLESIDIKAKLENGKVYVCPIGDVWLELSLFEIIFRSSLYYETILREEQADLAEEIKELLSVIPHCATRAEAIKVQEKIDKLEGKIDVNEYKIGKLQAEVRLFSKSDSSVS